MTLWRCLIVTFLAAIAAPQVATANACYGVTIQIRAHAKEESLVELFRELRQQHHLANLLPAKRVNAPDTTLSANTAEAQYSSHNEFRCAQALLTPTGAKLVSVKLNRNLPDGSVLLFWNEKSPVLYGAKSE